MLDTKVLSEVPRFDDNKSTRELLRELTEYNQKLAETLRHDLQVLESRTGGDACEAK